PDDAHNDRLVFSKGHASPLLYSMYRAAGAIGDQELLTFRTFGSRLQGHPTPAIPWVDVATGSLGQGLPYGVGIALAGKKLDRLPYRIWVLCGDSEIAEGSMWEAFGTSSSTWRSRIAAASRTSSRQMSSSCRPGSSVRRSRPGAHTATRWSRSAPHAGTSSRSTAR